MTPTTEVNENCLDPNHTHFLLVDNGTNNQPGAEIKFRVELEQQIANIKTGNSKGFKNILLIIKTNSWYTTLILIYIFWNDDFTLLTLINMH